MSFRAARTVGKEPHSDQTCSHSIALVSGRSRTREMDRVVEHELSRHSSCANEGWPLYGAAKVGEYRRLRLIRQRVLEAVGFE